MSGTEASARDVSAPRRTAQRAVDRLRSVRARVRSTRAGWVLWRTMATVLGVGIIVVGIVLLPLPGPGWLIIFAGLGVLASEYERAARLLRFARRQVSAWTDWVVRQPRYVQAVVGFAGLVFLAAVFALVWWFYGP